MESNKNEYSNVRLDGDNRYQDPLAEAKGIGPNLIRILSLDPNFAGQGVMRKPIRLLAQKDLESMIHDWTPEEIEDERRLVSFSFTRISPTDYEVTFDPIKKKDFTNNEPIISCILWKERNMHIATSVDIILILEYLVQESFTIEEKNRVRRNLLSLKPLTVSKSDKHCERFFKLLMNMENPRPRNIEKDLKVFKWSDLIDAFNKVISKYSINNQMNCDALEDESSHPKPTAIYKDSTTAGNKSDESRKRSTGSSDIDKIDSAVFLPNERLKVLRRNILQSDNVNQLNINRKNKLFKHALTPTDPIPINKFEQDKMSNNNSINNTSGNHIKGNSYGLNNTIREQDSGYGFVSSERISNLPPDVNTYNIQLNEVLGSGNWKKEPDLKLPPLEVSLKGTSSHSSGIQLSPLQMPYNQLNGSLPSPREIEQNINEYRSKWFAKKKN